MGLAVGWFDVKIEVAIGSFVVASFVVVVGSSVEYWVGNCVGIAVGDCDVGDCDVGVVVGSFVDTVGWSVAAYV